MGYIFSCINIALDLSMNEKLLFDLVENKTSSKDSVPSSNLHCIKPRILMLSKAHTYLKPNPEKSTRYLR